MRSLAEEAVRQRFPKSKKPIEIEKFVNTFSDEDQQYFADQAIEEWTALMILNQDEATNTFILYWMTQIIKIPSIGPKRCKNTTINLKKTEEAIQISMKIFG